MPPTKKPTHTVALVVEEPLSPPVLELDPIMLGGGVGAGGGPLLDPPPWTKYGFTDSWREVLIIIPFSFISPTQLAIPELIAHERLKSSWLGKEA